MTRLVFLLSFLFSYNALSAGEMDSQMVWPLCGRINENPPLNWTELDGCPANRAGDSAYNDAPLSSTFGPRPLASENNRYDFHRGVDIATPYGTPVFAITDGIVRTAGVNPSYSDPLIILRHFRPGENSCSAEGCYHSNYLHLSGWVVAQDQAVSKGQLIGYTGASGASGFEHLHFEVRDAPASDPFSSWSRDAVHPLSVVSYQVPNVSSITFNNVDTSNPSAITADLTINSNRYDLVTVQMTVFDQNLNPVSQPGASPDQKGYNINPPSFSMERDNFQYSHKNSSNFPWESYALNGVNQCPYHTEHSNSYSANVHMDAQHPNDYHEGLFNGIHVKTKKYWPTTDYWLNLEFLALTGPAQCIEATAVFASGDTLSQQWGNCSSTQPQAPVAPTNLTAQVVTSGKGKNKQRSLNLTWQDNADNEDEYILQRCQQTGKGKNKTCDYSSGLQLHLPVDSTSYQEDPESGTFKYRVKASNIVGESAFSNEVGI